MQDLLRVWGKAFKDIIIGCFILLVAFSYNIYFIILDGFDLTESRSAFQLYSGILASFVFLLFFFTGWKGRRFVSLKIAVLLLAACMLFLYYVTQSFYDYYSRFYNSYFLSMGVTFIPAVFMGCLMNKDPDILGKVDRALPIYVILYTAILSNVAFTAQLGANMLQTFSGGMSYQAVSYSAAYALGMTMYLIAYKSSNKLARLIYIGLALLQMIIAIMAGGRGAFVLGIVFVLYFGLKRFSFQKLIVCGIAAFAVLTIIPSLMSGNGVFQAGSERIFNFFGSSEAIEGDGRWVRWTIAWEAFLDSPLWGHGLGSVFYEVGFYSHNIFTDLLCEGGIILMSAFLYIVLKAYSSVKYLMKVDHRVEIMVIIFLCAFIMSCFSGYYLSETGIWLTMIYVIIRAPLERLRSQEWIEE